MRLTFLDPSGEHVTITTPITLSASLDDLLVLRDLVEAAISGGLEGLRVVVEEPLGEQPVDIPAPVANPVDWSDPSTWDYDPETVELFSDERHILKHVQHRAASLVDGAEPVAHLLEMRPPLIVESGLHGIYQLTPAGALVLDRILARERNVDHV